MQPAACPNDDTLQRFVAGLLVESDRVSLNDHVSGCDSCQRLLVELGRAEAPALPEQLEEFRVLERLGKGAMGEVYLAQDTRLDRRVAIKLIRVEGSEGHERLMREARAAARVHHPNLASVYRVAEHEGRPYLVSEYIDGQTLDELPRPLPAERVLAIAADLARGLAAAHRESVIHRDIKPQNAMLAKDGTAKLVDFGLAKSAGHARAGAALPDGASLDLTRTGAVVGTPRYLAPELWRGEGASRQTDVYAFGVMLFELCSGRPPHLASTVAELRDAVLTKPAAPLAEVVPRLDRRVCKLVDQCLALSPAQRFASGTELSAAIEAARAPERRAAPAVMALVALLVVGAAGVALSSRSGGAERPSARSGVAEAAQAFDEGLAWWRAGSTPPAVRRLTAAVEKDPTFAAAQLWLAFITPDVAAGRAAYSQAALHKSQLGDADLALLEALEPGQMPVPQLAQWQPLVEQVLARRPDDGALTLLRGRLHWRANEYAAAQADFTLAAQRDPQLRVPAAATAAFVRYLTLDAPTAALAQYASCVQQAPRSTDCLSGHARLAGRGGDCVAMQQDARSWASVDPQDPLAHDALANALFALGEPWPSVDEALRARAQISTGGVLANDAAALAAVARGDFDEARGLSDERWRAVAPGAGLMPHLEAAYGLLLVLEEVGDVEAAIALSRDVLDRAKAWTAEAPHEIATTLLFASLLKEKGAISDAEFATYQQRWSASMRQAQSRAGGLGGAGKFIPVLFGWAAVRTEEAARLVVAEKADEPMPPPGVMNASADLIIGRALLLAGRRDRALPYLNMVAGTCYRIEHSWAYADAQLLLGGDFEAHGDAAGAKAAYQRVVDLWGKAKPRSVHAEKAAARLEALGR